MFASMREEPSPDSQGHLPPPSERAGADGLQIEQQAAPSDTYPALGELLAIEFANTLFTGGDRPRDALATPAGLTRWVKTNAERIDAPSPRRFSAGDLERARELRAIILTLFATAVDGGRPDAAIIRQLNRLAALASFTARLDWPSGEPPEAHLSPSGPGRVGVLLALLAQSAIDVLGGSGAGRLRRCEAPGCTTYYLKDHPRRAWCSPKCGNRVRVARHYQRHHRTGS
jgi:predicted RNA-binding Zn ribbon-like protein